MHNSLEIATASLGLVRKSSDREGPHATTLITSPVTIDWQCCRKRPNQILHMLGAPAKHGKGNISIE